MKKALIVLTALLAILVVVVLVGPSLIDWNRYKDDIAARISAATGRQVFLDGPIDMSLLPSPTLTVGGARIANPGGASEPDLMRLERLDIAVAPRALLGGRIEVESFTLVRPTLVLEVLPDGRRTWVFGDADGEVPLIGRGARLADAIELKRMVIERGTVVYRDAAAGIEERLENIDARLTAGSLAGPFQFDGQAAFRDAALRFEILSGRVADGGALPLRATIGLADGSADLRFAGIAAPGPNARLQGDLRLQGGALPARLRTTLSRSASRAADIFALLDRPFGMRATIVAAPAAVELTGIDVTVGDARATGEARIVPGRPVRADVSLSLNRLDLDGWMAGRAVPAVDVGRGDAAGAGTPPAGAEGQPGFVMPDGLEGRFSLDLDALTWRGGLARQVRFSARLEQGLLSVDRLAALLPGGSDIVAIGTVAAQDGRPVFDLSVEANSDNLRAALAWLGIDVDDVPADRLRKFFFAGQVQGHADDFQLLGMDLRIDTTRVTGGVAFVDRGRPAAGLRLAVDSFNADAYLPATDDGAPVTPVSAMLPDVAALLEGFDANVAAEIGSLVLGGQAMQNLLLDATVNGGRLTIRRARVETADGMSADVRGQAAGLSPLTGLDLEIVADAPSLVPVVRAFDLRLPVPPERFGSVGLSGRLRGDPDRIALETELRLAQGMVTLAGTVSALDEAPNYDIKARATWNDALDLSRLIAPEYRPTLAEPGPFDVYAELAGSPDAFSLSAIQGQVGPVSVRGEASVDLAVERPTIVADLQTSAIVIDDFLSAPERRMPAVPLPVRSAFAADGRRWSEATFDLEWLDAVDGRLSLTSAGLHLGDLALGEPAFVTRLEDGTLTLDQLDAAFLGGRLGLTGTLAASGDVPTLDAVVTLVGASPGDGPLGTDMFGMVAGTFDLDLSLETTGRSESDMIAGLGGTGSVRVGDGAILGFDLDRVARRIRDMTEPEEVGEALRPALSGGRTEFERFEGSFTVEKGVLQTRDLSFVGDAGTATLLGTADLSAMIVDLVADVTLGDPGTPDRSFGVSLSGPVGNPARAIDATLLERFVARKVAAETLRRLDERPEAGVRSVPEQGPEPTPAPEPTPEPVPARTQTPAAAETPATPEANQVIQGILDRLRR